MKIKYYRFISDDEFVIRKPFYANYTENVCCDLFVGYPYMHKCYIYAGGDMKMYEKVIKLEPKKIDVCFRQQIVLSISFYVEE